MEITRCLIVRCAPETLNICFPCHSKLSLCHILLKTYLTKYLGEVTLPFFTDLMIFHSNKDTIWKRKKLSPIFFKYTFIFWNRNNLQTPAQITSRSALPQLRILESYASPSSPSSNSVCGENVAVRMARVERIKVDRRRTKTDIVNPGPNGFFVAASLLHDGVPRSPLRGFDSIM